MYISKETSAGSGGMCLYNHKDGLVIYLLFGSYPLPPQASSSPPPSLLHFITGTQYNPPSRGGKHMGPRLNFCNESFQCTIPFKSYF